MRLVLFWKKTSKDLEKGGVRVSVRVGHREYGAKRDCQRAIERDSLDRERERERKRERENHS